jgi:hypothetical protein
VSGGKWANTGHHRFIVDDHGERRRMNWKKIGSITALRVARAGLVLGLVPPSALNQRLTNAIQAPPTCYDIRLGDWTPRLKLGEDTAYVLPPRRISVAPNETGAWRPLVELAHDVRAVVPRPGSQHRRGYWRTLPADSAEVVFTTGFSGVRFFVHRDGDNWRGVAETFWDFDRPSQHAPVTLTRASCH